MKPIKHSLDLDNLENRDVVRGSKRQSSKLHVSNSRGIFALVTALSVVSLFAFVALGIEVGRWYVVRAELSKSVDAAALLGAKNYSNPFLVTEDLMAAVGQANFSPGLLGTEGNPQITGTKGAEGKVFVEGSTNVLNKITQVVEMQDHIAKGTYEKTYITSSGVAQQREVEIMLVLDESGSMSSAMSNLKTAAKSFVDFFEHTDDTDQMGLITFASGVVVERALGPNFYDDMTTAIDNMSASGGTNTEDALDQADGPSGFTDQTGIPGDERVQQFLVFFSDGNPTAFRGDFTRNGTDYDAVGYAANWDIKLMNPNSQFSYLNVKQYETGDGKTTGSTVCQSGSPLAGYSNTKWHVLDDPTYGVSGYSDFLEVYYSDLLGTTDPEKCSLNWNKGRDYVEAITKQMAIDHAQEVKDKGIKIYTVGLGSVDQDFLSQIASGPGFEYFAPTSADLKNLFQKIATNIRLRLVQ
ncbi:TadE/TadG family type IV pilus assembly protein [Candidatus Nitronereus thalassa]|uniref:VWA domain-containing protein n=1 Tax=Candidatus Nitronereus thalassa TaxID=3020898 RepID=A0ABU3K3N1_9BACT|nr:VWA domain-containing protein [Candidatus Nitronereus thalassa]MDT7040998.1 VWA domain-containing protein [Candidatus Nitronereus thalassa]